MSSGKIRFTGEVIAGDVVDDGGLRGDVTVIDLFTAAEAFNVLILFEGTMGSDAARTPSTPLVVRRGRGLPLLSLIFTN